MPELPEVETIRRDLSARLLGQKITSVNILSPKTASQPAVFLKKTLVGRRIIKIIRRGKLLIFQLTPVKKKFGAGKKEISSSATSLTAFDYLLIHLKMTGQLIYISDFAVSVGGALPNKYTRAIIVFAASGRALGGRLFFNDLRKFGYLRLATASELKTLLNNNYGPEPLTSNFSLAVLGNALKNKKIKIKPLLLNQKLIAGLGNIYADEALWLARINPERPAGSLKPREIKKLRQAINRIIKQAIKYRGTTFNNYVDSRGRRGNFYNLLKVYGRQGEKCPNCHGPISKKKVAGRGAHYCPRCQK